LIIPFKQAEATASGCKCERAKPPPLAKGIRTLCDSATARRRIPKGYHYQSQLGGYYTAEKNTIVYIEGVFSYGGIYANMGN